MNKKSSNTPSKDDFFLRGHYFSEELLPQYIHTKESTITCRTSFIREKDVQFFYFTKGKGKIRVNGQCFELSTGSFAVFHPFLFSKVEVFPEDDLHVFSGFMNVGSFAFLYNYPYFPTTRNFMNGKPFFAKLSPDKQTVVLKLFDELVCASIESKEESSNIAFAIFGRIFTLAFQQIVEEGDPNHLYL